MRKLLALLLISLIVQPAAAQRAAEMEAGVYRAVIQQHGGSAGAIVFRTLEDGDLCWTKLVSAECITAAEQKEFGAAVANFRKMNPMPQTGTWSEDALKL